MNNVIVTYCECPGTSGHLPGCSLHLRLLIKYGDLQRNIKGVVELFNEGHIASKKSVAIIDEWHKNLIETWQSEKRTFLKFEECGWLQSTT